MVQLLNASVFGWNDASDAVLHGHVPMAHVVRARLERSLIKTTLSWGVQDG